MGKARRKFDKVHRQVSYRAYSLEEIALCDAPDGNGSQLACLASTTPRSGWDNRRWLLPG